VPADEVEPAVSPWLTLVILILTILAFVGSSMLTQWIAGGVNEDALSIATNAAPAIQDLTNARDELVRIAIAARPALSSTQGLDEPALATLAEALPALRQNLRRYLKHPFYPLEEARYTEVDRSVDGLEARAADLEAAVAAGDQRAALDVKRTGLLRTVGRVDRAISQLVELNTQQLRRLGLEIPQRRRHAHEVGYALQATTAILSLILMSLVIRGTRDYARLLALARAASRARDDLLATVSHDLRNPINAIILTVRALRRASSDPRTDKQTARIQRATERMNRLIDDLLDAAKIEAGVLRIEPRPEDASGLIEAAIELHQPIAEEKSVRLAWCPPASAAVVSGDRHLILRVLSNIIGNAIKFTPPGGSTTVRAERLAAEVQFSVSDEGPGIPAEHRPYIFDRYWYQKTGNRRGSGLGLYIAKGIVEAHGGRIWIEAAGPGTTVSFTLLLDRAPGGSPGAGG
jgi:signal transduction histidine kinase